MKRLLSALGILLALGVGVAQMTPAGTSIQNQASATYLDSAGQSRTTTSNQVVTVVQQVYAFTITPDGTPATPSQTRYALPGAQVIFAYTVTNTGNGNDTISLATAQGTGDGFDLSSLSIVRDDDCDGRVDPGEPTVTSVALARGQSACVLVVGTIPAGQNDGDVALVNLVGTPSGGSTDTNNWARAVAKAAAALDITKSASPSGTVSPGSSITYTVSGQNRGGSAAGGVNVGSSDKGILVADPIPVGLTVSSMPSGAAGAGTVQILYSTDEGATWSALVAGNLPLTGADADGDSVPDVWVGMFISGSDAFFPPNASYTFSFSATVPANALPGTVYRNTATVRYHDGSDDQTLSSNTTANTVGAGYGVAVGPLGHPEGKASGSYLSGSYTITRDGDSQSVASVHSGTKVIFRHTLRNRANTADSFNLARSSPPSGWNCTLAQTDGTPISGPVGPLAAGATFDFQLECTIPASSVSTSPLTLTVSATSVGDSSKTDTTTDTVMAVASGYAVDLAAHGEAGDGDATDDNPANQSANPGSTLNLPFDVFNGGQVADTYTFSAAVPLGWGITYYPDADCNGLMDSPPTPVTSSGLINPGTRGCFIAALSVPAGATPGDNPVSITATSTTVSSVSNTISTTVTVNEVRALLFDPDRAGTVTTPGTIVYTHNLINNGNASATVSIPPFASAYGWTYQFSADGNNWTSSISGLSVPPGTLKPVWVRVTVPSGQPVGRSEAATLTATATYPSGGIASDSVTDTTTVIAGELRLEKSGVSYEGTSSSVRDPNAATAYPGDRIVYTITATNIGTGDLKFVRISDPLPAYTNFVSVSATSSVSGTVLYSTDGSSWSPMAPTSLPAGGVIYVGVDTDGNNTIDNGDILPPAARIVIALTVEVQ